MRVNFLTVVVVAAVVDELIIVQAKVLNVGERRIGIALNDQEKKKEMKPAAGKRRTSCNARLSTCSDVKMASARRSATSVPIVFSMIIADDDEKVSIDLERNANEPPGRPCAHFDRP